MTPRTDKERILHLEARCAELESELAEFRTQAREAHDADSNLDGLDHLRSALRRADEHAGGPTIAAMLLGLLAASPKALSRDRMFSLSRNHRCKPIHDSANTRTLDVQMVRLRRALANLGFPGVIQTRDGRGWAIGPNDRDALKATFGL